jgi:hypothetical protein
MAFRGYSTTGPIYWLRRHPHCDVGIINEYGEFAEWIEE